MTQPSPLSSLFKQNIKWCNAKRRMQCQSTVKTTVGLIIKKATLHVQHTFFVHFIAVVLHDYNVKTCRNFLVTRFMEEILYVFLFTFLSLPLIFTLHWWPLAFLIFSPPLQNFHVLPTKKCLLCFLSLALNLCRPFSC